jgi:hypothetical protein
MPTLPSKSMPESDFLVLCNQIATARVSLFHTFHDLTSEQRSRLEPKLSDLQDAMKQHQIFSSFQKSLQQVDKNWIPKGKIEQIVQACCNQRYAKHDIERIFYEHGGISGLLVLHLGTRFQNALFAQVYALPFELTRELAIRCGKEDLNPYVKVWIDSFDRSSGMFFLPCRSSHD